MKKEWEDVTDTFSEERRHWKNTYLEIDEVYGEDLEVSLFSSWDEEGYEVYFSWDYFYGVIHVNKNNATEIWLKVKKELQEGSDTLGKPNADFVNSFGKRYKVDIINAIF